jgi:hypothetical protein
MDLTSRFDAVEEQQSSSLSASGVFDAELKSLKAQVDSPTRRAEPLSPPWLPHRGSFESTIISDFPGILEGMRDKTIHVPYGGRHHGVDAASFPRQCDDQSHTLVLVKTKKGYIFGGYTIQPWGPPPEGQGRALDFTDRFTDTAIAVRA